MPPIAGLAEASRGTTARATAAKEVPRAAARARRRRDRRRDGPGVPPARRRARSPSSRAAPGCCPARSRSPATRCGRPSRPRASPCHRRSRGRGRARRHATVPCTATLERRPDRRSPTRSWCRSAPAAATADLGLETVGLKPGGSVEVDDRLRAVGVAGGLAVRRRRLQRAGPAHPHGQVPGPDRRRRHPRPGRPRPGQRATSCPG